MLLQEAVTLYLDHRRDRVLASSYKTYVFWIERWQEWRLRRRLPPELHQVNQKELAAYLLSMKRSGLEPASLDATWRIWRALWRLLARRGLLAPHQLAFFGPDGLARPHIPDVVRAPYDPADIERLLAAASGPPEQRARDQAMILLLWESGARSSELCSLDDRRVQLDRRRAVIRGKGDIERWIYWGPRGAATLAAYLALRSPEPGPVFRSLRGEGGITTGALRQMIKRLAKAADVALLPRGPVHNFRRTFAHAALDTGEITDLDLQQLMGHKSIISTQAYTRRDPEMLSRIHGRIFR